MNFIKIVETSTYLPKNIVENKQIEEKLNLEDGYIYKRTGIRKRYYATSCTSSEMSSTDTDTTEKIEEMAKKAVQKIFDQNISKENIGLILVATTTSNKLMPGIANYIQKELQIDNCICLDILAGCSGYINSLDIAKMYIETGKIEKALIVGVDILSQYTDPKDVSTAIILADGAGATLIEKTNKNKKYFSNIKAEGANNQILTCESGQKIHMDGKEVYRYAVVETVESIKETLEKSGETLNDIKYIVPHQSNMKIIKSIATRLKIDMSKIYTNIENVGNTFCASIPIALDEMRKKDLLQEGDKILLIGYGGGLNTGSILLEI